VEAALPVVGVYDGVSFAWILRTEHGAALIDAGMDTGADAVVEELKRQGLGPEDVHTLLLTHGHGDHVGGARVFFKAKVYAGPGEGALVRGERRSNRSMSRLLSGIRPPPPSPSEVTELTDGQTLEVDGQSLRVIHLPGHTEGSAAYLWRDVLFTGDALLRDGDGVGLPPAFLSEDAEQARASLSKLVKEPFTLLADGHTGVTADARQKLERLLR
jgi:glyoxylase-like metal-dependent hydrolase (beta-lactamase superfamily II)